MKLLLAIGTCSLLLACSTKTSKKVIVYAKGTATVNEKTQTIDTKDGAGQDEKILSYSQSEAITLHLNTPQGSNDVAIAQDGLYILNAKKDTLVGGFVHFVDPRIKKNVTTQEELKADIDSLEMLVAGKNVSEQNKSFMILPRSAAKISDNLAAEVVGPFHKLTTLEKVDGKIPDVYKFYTLKEMRETINKLKLLTVAEKR